MDHIEKLTTDLLDVMASHRSRVELDQLAAAREPIQLLDRVVRLLLGASDLVGAPGERSIQLSISPYSRPRLVFQMAKPPKDPENWQADYIKGEIGDWVRYRREIGDYQIELWGTPQ